MKLENVSTTDDKQIRCLNISVISCPNLFQDTKCVDSLFFLFIEQVQIVGQILQFVEIRFMCRKCTFQTFDKDLAIFYQTNQLS